MDSTLPPIFPTPPSKNAQRYPPAPCASKGTSPGLATAGATTVTRFSPQLTHSKVSLWQRPLAITPRINRRQRTGGGIDCAEGDSGPPRYAVRPAGRAPARLAVHCCLATGGPGAATPHAPFGRPRLAFAKRKPSRFATYVFAFGEYVACGALWVLSRAGKVPRPPAGGRNLPQEINSLWKARERTFLAFPVSQKIAPLRRRPGGFPIAPWTPSGPIPVYMGETSHKKQISCDRQETGLPFFPRVTNTFAFAEAPRGFPLAPWAPSGVSYFLPAHGASAT